MTSQRWLECAVYPTRTSKELLISNESLLREPFTTSKPLGQSLMISIKVESSKNST